MDFSTDSEEIDSSDNTISSKYIVFYLGRQRVGVPLAQVCEVLEFTQIISTGLDPEYFLGYFIYREQVVPVLDFQIKFNIPNIPTDTPPVTLVCDGLSRPGLVAIRSQRVEKIISLTTEALLPGVTINSDIRGDYLIGIIDNASEGQLPIVDLDKLFSKEDWETLAAIRKT